MNNIRCDFWDYEKKEFWQTEVDLDGNLYPCCHIYIQKYEDNEIIPELKNIDINLKNRNYQDILNDFYKIFNEENWKSEQKCPKFCKKICSVTKND